MSHIVVQYLILADSDQVLIIKWYVIISLGFNLEDFSST